MTDESIERLNIIFSGRVQGVGFRATCRSLARKSGLAGWVRNLPDGQVALEIQGASSLLGTFRSDLRKTHAGHGIRDEKVTRLSPEHRAQGFDIVR